MEWAAEREVDAVLAAELVGGQFAELRGLPVRLLATGWDNTVHLVGGRWAFRFPRRAVAVPLGVRELALLPALAPLLPLPIPVPEFAGAPSKPFPWPFWGARLLPGRELAEAAPPDGRRERAAAQVGGFLRALHDPMLAGSAAEVTGAAGAELRVDPLHRGDPSVRAPLARERLDRLVRRGVTRPDPALDRLLADGARLGPPAGAPVLVHGDLHVRHLLIDGAGRASGIIDWGDMCLADPAVDLALAYCGFAGPARAALLGAYGPIGPEREMRARVLAAFLCAALAEYAAAEGDRALLREALAGLRRAAGD